MLHRCVLLTAILFCCTDFLPAQVPAAQQVLPPTGLSLQYGLGQYALRDEYISQERYSGIMPYVNAEWSRFHGKWGYRMGLEFRHANEIRNNNVTAEILHAALYRDYIYPIGRKSFLGKDVHLFLGPTTGIHLYFNDQQIAAQHALNIDFSLAALFSLGMNSTVVIPLRSDLQLEGSLRLGLLAIGMRSVDVVEEEGSMGGILTALSGTDPATTWGIRYFISDKLSLTAAYKLQILSISKWNPLLSVDDNITLTLSVHL